MTAGIAMSEPAPGDRHDLDAMYEHVTIPVFVMTGTLDEANEMMALARSGVPGAGSRNATSSAGTSIASVMR